MKTESFTHTGKRSNNEDCKGSNERLWMVCDGVGGHVSGERASQFVVDGMLKLFAQDETDLKKATIEERLIQVQEELNAVLDREPELEKMGTTFTGVFKTKNFWYAAHIGDSRIYLFRPSEKKLWHTWDHSLVGELMKNHDITREDGRFHPMSNRISKAIIANSDNKVQRPDIVKIDELRAGDIFLLCSDGVVEAWGDHELVDLFEKTEMTLENKCNIIEKQCNQLSKDNNTALLIEIEAGDAFSIGNGENEELKWVTFQDIRDDFKEYERKQQSEEEQPDTESADATISENAEAEEQGETSPVLAGDNPVSSNSMPKSHKCLSGCPPPKTTLFKYVIALLLLLIGIVIGVWLGRGQSQEPTKAKPKQETKKKTSADDNENGILKWRKGDRKNSVKNSKKSDKNSKKTGKDNKKSGKDNKKSTKGNKKSDKVGNTSTKNTQPSAEDGKKAAEGGDHSAEG